MRIEQTLKNNPLWRWIGILFFSFSIVITNCLPLAYAVPPSAAKEYQIKAVFLYNFTHFITWPESAFDSEEDNFNICILGKDPFGLLLDFTAEKQKSKDGHPLAVKRMNDLSGIDSCHILFISESEKHRLKDIFRITDPYPILTVSEIDNFVRLGGMVKFFNRNNKIRLGVNPDSLKAVGLQANANFLNLCEIIN